MDSAQNASTDPVGHAEEAKTTAAPVSASAAGRRPFGKYPGVIALLLFSVAGVAAWKGGLVDEVLRVLPSFAAVGNDGAASVPKSPVNVNAASREELLTLPSVSEKIAADIEAKRPFSSVDDLVKVKGIGEKKLEKLRPFVRVE